MSDSGDRRPDGDGPQDVPPTSPEQAEPGATEQPTPPPVWTAEPAPPPHQAQPGYYGVPPMAPAQSQGYWQPAATIKPGVIPLRPLGLGEILDGAISTMRAHPGMMLGVAAIVVTISQLLTLAVTFPWLDDINQALDPTTVTTDEAFDLLGKSLTIGMVSLMILLVSRVFLSGFVTLVVGKAVLGQPLSFAGVWASVRPRLLPLFGLTLIYPAVGLGVGIVVALLVIAVPPLGVLVIIGLIPVVIWLWVLFSLATPVLVLENARIGQAFGRSRQLVRGSWWRIFGISLLAAVIAGIIAIIIQLPFEAFGGGFANVTAGATAAALTTKYLLLTTIGGIIASTITEPFAAGVTVLLYTDQRMRNEGLDIELARAAGVAPPPNPGYPGYPGGAPYR